MDTEGWSREDHWLAAICGTCEFCEFPRTARFKKVQGGPNDGAAITVLVCTRCGREAT